MNRHYPEILSDSSSTERGGLRPETLLPVLGVHSSAHSLALHRLWRPDALGRTLATEGFSNDVLASSLLSWGASRFLGVGDFAGRSVNHLKNPKHLMRTNVSLQRVFVWNCIE